jgi:uncharacterized protein YecE (DUF72 family)
MEQATLFASEPQLKFPSLRIGTSGFSYDDWVGPFYPPTLQPRQRLEYYAQHFDTTEINSTFYQLPALASIHGMLRKVPAGFTFFVKGHRDLTHGTRKKAKETLSKFLFMLEAYRDEEKLAGVLLQFPSTFECSPHNEDYLRWLVESFEKTRVVIEFRHVRWITEQGLELLRELGAGYCIVDMPQVRDLPSSRVEATTNLAYVRFHGQNSPKWAGKATRDERYDYEYTDEELREWVEPIDNLTKYVEQTYVYFNNHYRAKAAKNAQMLKQLVAERKAKP